VIDDRLALPLQIGDDGVGFLELGRHDLKVLWHVEAPHAGVAGGVAEEGLVSGRRQSDRNAAAP
jgi:hypothetical protein